MMQQSIVKTKVYERNLKIEQSLIKEMARNFMACPTRRALLGTKLTDQQHVMKREIVQMMM